MKFYLCTAYLAEVVPRGVPAPRFLIFYVISDEYYTIENGSKATQIKPQKPMTPAMAVASSGAVGASEFGSIIC